MSTDSTNTDLPWIVKSRREYLLAVVNAVGISEEGDQAVDVVLDTMCAALAALGGGK